jgi:predicted AlkP superfamily pyrophosphatase or phosphodiesterase
MTEEELMRRLPVVVLAGLLIASCAPAFCFDPATPPAQRNLILFSWDGVQREHLKECLSRNELPNLAALSKEGGMVDIDVTSHNTDTKAGHTQMLTGYDPDVTGVMSNSKFKAIAPGLSMFERLDQRYGKDNIVTIMLTGKTHHIGSCPPSTPEAIADAKAKIEKIQAGKPKGKGNTAQAGNTTGVADPDAAAQANQKQKAKVQQLSAIIQNTDGEPFYSTSKALDVWDGEKSRDHTVVGPLMLGYLDKYKTDRICAFFHFSDPDHKGHNKGENSTEYNQAIIDCDTELGECVKKLKALGIYDKTMIFVTADHGFDEGKTSHMHAPRVVLAANLKSLTKNGDQRDLVPTMLTEMGLDISKLDPKLKGTALTSK